MKIKYLMGALALAMSSTAFAAEPAPASKKQCCCKQDEAGKMACCKEKGTTSGDEHKDHAMSGMDHK